MNNTAISANKEKLIFKNESHRKFYEEWLPKCRYQDVYHKALVYCLGINEDTRNHINEIYDFKNGCVQTECLQQGWNTSGSVKVIRMAFNLYCNGRPSVDDYKEHEKQMMESRQYSVEELLADMQGFSGRQLSLDIRSIVFMLIYGINKGGYLINHRREG